jgi:hypothetical protein
MPFWTKKKAKGLLVAVLALGYFAYKDWSHFFPLSAHSDLRFQVVGEFLALLALAGVFMMPVAESRGDAWPSTLTLRWWVLTGTSFSLFLFVMYWRCYFPNDSFSLQAGAMDFPYARAVGLAVFWFTFFSSLMVAKPSREHEGSVV